MSIYRTLYPAVEAKVLDRVEVQGRVHGSEVQDLFLEHARGRFMVDDHAERLLTELVDDGVLKVGNKVPTRSQAAFTGLGISARYYKTMGWEPGVKTHFHYLKAES